MRKLHKGGAIKCVVEWFFSFVGFTQKMPQPSGTK
ncbi:hypothetical protein MJC1_02941 [Methylocystis sp. MJC1]|nr:hypothetical protein MJC1_02941 [Methylocystis sp. MJC1]